MGFWERVVDACKRAGVSVRQVSTLATGSPTIISAALSQGQHEPVLSRGLRIAQVLGTNVEYLAHGSGPPPSADEVRAAVSVARAELLETTPAA